MSLNNYVKISVFCLVCLLSSMPSAQAQWPTLDFSAITTKVQGIKQQVDQYKTQIMESKAVGSINSAIGDAKASMSKFSMDKIAQAKKLAEKAKKEAEKIKKVKEDIEKAKKEYEEKKKEFDEYKKQLDEAKQMAKDAKEVASSATDLAKQGISDAKSMASNKLGNVASSVNASSLASKAGVSSMVEKASGAATKVSGGAIAPNMAGNIKQTVSSANVAVQNNSGAALKSMAVSDGAVMSKASLGAVKQSAAAGSALSKVSAGTVNPTAVSGGGALSKASLGSVKQSGLASSAASFAQPQVQGRTAFSAAASKAVTESANVAKELSAGDKLEKVKDTAAVDGVPSGTAGLNKMLKAAIDSHDTQALDAIANIDEADIVNSKSKIYDPETAKTNVKLDSKSAPLSDKAVKADVKALGSKAVGDLQAIGADTVNKSLAPLSEEEVKAKADSVFSQASAAVSQTSSALTAKADKAAAKESKAAAKASAKESASAAKKGVSDIKSGITSASTAAVNAQAGDTLRAAIGSSAAKTDMQINRTSFQPMQKPDKESSLWLDDGDRARQSSVKLSSLNTLMFASAASGCEYNNSMVSGDDGEIVILPPTLAKECCIKAPELEDLNVIKDCVNKLLTEMHKDDNSEASTGKEIYANVMYEQSLFGVVESLEDTNMSTSYEADVLAKYKDKMKEFTPNSGDGTNMISETNAQLLYLFNRIRRMYATGLVTTGLDNINNFDKRVLSEDTDIGVGEVKEEYRASVARQDIDYPVIPENMAKKCLIKVQESPEKVKDCYMKIVSELYVKDFKDAEVSANYANNIKYQNILDILGKSLYQKVKSAKYAEQLQKTKEQNADAETSRTKNDALFNTDYEIQEALDDIINLFATRVAQSSLNNITQLSPLSTETKG